MHVDGRAGVTKSVSVSPDNPQKVKTDRPNGKEIVRYGPWMIPKRNMGKKLRGGNNNHKEYSKMETIKKDSNNKQTASKEGRDLQFF